MKKMLSKSVEKRLILIEKIEKTMSDIYGSLAVNQAFTDEARRFWTTMMGAELEHAALFRNIRDKARHNKTVQIEINFDIDQLLKSYKIMQKAQKIIRDNEISEKQAYKLGFDLEEKLYEFSYCKRVKSNNSEIMKEIRKIDNDTKHHYILLHNCALKKLGDLMDQ